MKFLHLLKKSGVTTGFLFDSNTSNSNLGSIKLFLFGDRPSSIPEKYLVFGNTLHLRCLTGSKANGNIDVRKLNAMVKAFKSHKIVKRLMDQAVCEQKLYVNIHGAKFAIILDIEQTHLKQGSDLKSTSAKSLAEFIQKAIELDYFRQGLVYKIGRNLKEFFFIGLSKQPPHEIFIFRIDDFPDELEYAKQELEFLTYWYKTYGKPIWTSEAKKS